MFGEISFLENQWTYDPALTVTFLRKNTKDMNKENLFKKCIAYILSWKNLFSRYFHFIFPLRDWVQAYKHLRNNEKMQRKKLCKIDDCMYWCIYLELDFLNYVKKARQGKEYFNIWHREF